MNNAISSRSGKTVLGFPLAGFSLLQSLLLTLASTLIVFFGATAVAIFALLIWNGLGHHTVNYADSYLYVGLPAGVLVFVIAAPVFVALWVRARLRK